MSTELEPTQAVGTLEVFAERHGMPAEEAREALVKTILPGDNVSKGQVVAFLSVANAHGLNPFTKEIFAFPSRGGIVPIVSIDGWYKLAGSHPQYDGVEFFDELDPEGNIRSTECVIHRKDRSHPTRIREYMGECKGNTEPWKKWPARMLRHKSFIQCARAAFSFAGIYDEDEGRRIADVPRDVAAEEVAQTNALLAPQDPPNAPEDLNYQPPAEEPHSEPQEPSVLSDADADAAEAARADEGLFEEGSPSYD